MGLISYFSFVIDVYIVSQFLYFMFILFVFLAMMDVNISAKRAIISLKKRKIPFQAVCRSVKV